MIISKKSPQVIRGLFIIQNLLKPKPTAEYEVHTHDALQPWLDQSSQIH